MTARRFARSAVLLSLFGLVIAPGCGGGGGGGSVPFRVERITPADGAIDVSIGGMIEVAFTRPVEGATVQNGITFLLTESSMPGSPLAGVISFDSSGKVLTFTPSSPLAFSATYRVDLVSGIEDTVGRSLDLAGSPVPIPSTFETQIVPDTTPPTFAGATAAMGITDMAIEVTWGPAMDDIDAPSALVYNVYAATSSGGQNFSLPDSVSAPGATSDIAVGLLPATTYFFVVRAVDTSGNEDGNLVEVSAATLAAPDTMPPVFSGVASAVAMSPTEVQLTWSAATDNQAAPGQIVYNIYIATVSGGQGFAAPDVTTPAGAISHQVTGLAPGTPHFFVVRAEDPSGNEDGNTVEAQAATMVSFAAQVGPIFSSNCAVAGCHSGSTPQQGMNLSSFAQIDSTAINVPANETIATSMLDRIEPLDSGSSYLQHKVDGTHLDPSVMGSGVQMPFGRPPLSQADRDLIRTWIDEGALNN